MQEDFSDYDSFKKIGVSAHRACEEAMDLYQDLGRLVVEQCPPRFRRAVLNAELDQDWAELKIICTLEDSQTVEADIPAIAVADIHDRLDDIREGMAAQAGAKWRTCTFTVESDGRFKLDVEY